MKVLITGATGLIGSAIVQECQKKKITVHYLTTSKDKLKQEEGYKGFYWSPNQGEIDASCLEGVDTIINLTGASIAKRWTKKRRNLILKSRVQPLYILKKTLAQNKHQVKHFISASAIGIYPSSYTKYYDETYPDTSSTFLGRVVRAWEREAEAITELGIKVTKIRIGLVLSEKGGTLPALAKPIRHWVGAPLGKGLQWQSWIHIKDLTRLFVFVITHKLEGTYNAVSPNPVTQMEFVKTIAKTLNKPLLIPYIPKWIVAWLLGRMHILLIESQRVSSKKIEDAGFRFKYYHLKSALGNLLS